jgi:hypothetical protein
MANAKRRRVAVHYRDDNPHDTARSKRTGNGEGEVALTLEDQPQR